MHGSVCSQVWNQPAVSSFSSSDKPLHRLHTFVTCCWLLRGPLIQGRGGNVCNDPASNMAEHHVCHIPFVRDKSLSLVDAQQQKNLAQPFEGSVKNLQTHFTVTTEYMFNFRRAASSHSEDTGKTLSFSYHILRCGGNTRAFS